MIKKILEGRIIVEGNIEGEVLISKEPFMFAHGANPKTGKIVDKKSDVYGKNMKNKIFVFSYGKGSTTGSMWFLEAIRRGNGPKAIVNQETEMIIATGAVLGHLMYGKKTVVIDKVDLEKLGKINPNNSIAIKGNKIEVK